MYIERHWFYIDKLPVIKHHSGTRLISVYNPMAIGPNIKIYNDNGHNLSYGGTEWQTYPVLNNLSQRAAGKQRLVVSLCTDSPGIAKSHASVCLVCRVHSSVFWTDYRWITQPEPAGEQLSPCVIVFTRCPRVCSVKKFHMLSDAYNNWKMSNNLYGEFPRSRPFLSECWYG